MTFLSVLRSIKMDKEARPAPLILELVNRLAMQSVSKSPSQSQK
jgi:hypothetical protein